LPSHDARDRVAIAKIAANTHWSKVPDRAARTAGARGAFLQKFEREVDPDGVMSPADRAKAAENARKAHFQRLARRSAQARKRAAAATAEAEVAEAELAEAEAQETEDTAAVAP
jgi:hypothetical protein